MSGKKDYDDFINCFSNLFHKLEKTKSEKLFKKLLGILMNRLNQSKYAMDQSLWKMLYFQSIYFYKNPSYLGRIPIKYVTKHNHIVPFYMSKKIHHVDYAIVRFDTHSDLNEIKDSHQLPLLYKKYLDTNDNKYLDKAQDIVWDIGAAKSGVLISTGIKDLVWVMPDWVPDPLIEVEYFMKENKKSCTLQSTDPKSDFDLVYVKNVKKEIGNAHTKTYKKLRIGDIKKTSDQILEIIKKKGDRFILDIDLDFFVCNGEKFDPSYFDIPFDLKSFYRTKTIEINENVPRYKYEPTKELLQYTKKLTQEMKKINHRIKKFIKLIRMISKHATPYLITMSDSSNVMFGDCEICNSISNGYVPTNLALYVHTKVVEELKKIYE